MREQEKLIDDFISYRAGFENHGAELLEFIENRKNEGRYLEDHVVAHFYLPPTAEFAKIENKISLYNLHTHFIIFACF